MNIDEFTHAAFRTPELYFGFNFAEGRNQLGNEEGFSKNKIVDYKLPGQFKQHYFYMDGMWKNNNDGMKLISDSGKIVLQFSAKQVNIVAANNAILKITYDGMEIPSHQKVEVKMLHTRWNSQNYRTQIIQHNRFRTKKDLMKMSH